MFSTCVQRCRAGATGDPDDRYSVMPVGRRPTTSTAWGERMRAERSLGRQALITLVVISEPIDPFTHPPMIAENMPAPPPACTSQSP